MRIGARAGWVRRGTAGTSLFTINRVLVVALLAAVLGTVTVHRCTRGGPFGVAEESAARASEGGARSLGKGLSWQSRGSRYPF